jgi:putative ABC transport system permease protein
VGKLFYLFELAITPRGLATLLVANLVFLVLLLAIGKVPLNYNLRNLTVRWWTTLLTALAFTLVVALLVAMLAFVNGMAQMTAGSGQSGNVVVFSDGANDEVFSNLAFSDDLTDLERQPGVIRDAEGKPLCSREIYIVAGMEIPEQPAGPQPSGLRRFGSWLVGLLGVQPSSTGTARRRFIQLRGIEDVLRSAAVHGLELKPGGKWFSDSGVQSINLSPAGSSKSDGAANSEQAIQAVVGSGVARQLGLDQGKPQLEPGDVFSLGPRKWVVTGIIESDGTTYGSEIWAKRSIVGAMYGKEQAYSTIVLRTADAEAAQKLATYLSKDYKKAAVSAQTELEYFVKLSETNQQFLFASVFVAVVMAIGGVFGVMNTMFAAISQRTKDIGVMRILGYTRRQILVSFLLESLLISLLGGILGCALGSLVNGWTASSIVGGGGAGGKFVVLKLVVDANTLAIGMLFTLTMGELGGLIPALNAMRLKPLESLR